ncbi:MAG: hypothetical protein RL034_363, partial [Bacteroidota bacterium]
MKSKSFILFVLVLSLGGQLHAQHKPLVLKTNAFKHYIDYFNGMEDEN